MKKQHSQIIKSLAAATALSTLMAVPASAQDLEELKRQLAALAKKVEKLEEAKKKSVTVKKAEPAFGLATDDGLFEMNIRGRLYTDYITVSDSDGNFSQSGTEFRTARLGIEGKAWKDTKYKFEIEVDGNDVNVKDAYMQFKTSMGSITAGQFKTPNSLDEQTSSRHISFLERASITDAFGFARQTGIMWSNGDSNYTAKLGVFKGSTTDSGSGDTTIAGRVTYGDKMDGGKWLVGGSFRDRSSDGQFRYRQRPHVHLSDRFVNTDRIGNGDDFFYGVEGAIQYGSFYSSAEYGILNAKEASVSNPGSDAKLHGGYIDIGYFVTGESRTLKTDKGAWDRPKVSNPVYNGGMGALAVTARYDTLDLTGDGIYGGEMDTWIIGLNWYLNRHSRIVVNYSNSSIDGAFDVSANGADGKNSVDAFGVRFQVDW
ncbi:porin [Temperatibacter marinus]|uniref:Porin n=1 Tax=Temperatibacter marinus TaxID=1456591 RepID=A0AA52EHW6_9PROT|nr:porin [Temperatibacter marinus]WND03468.1 porin [Temperatibacter marinus]